MIDKIRSLFKQKPDTSQILNSKIQKIYSGIPQDFGGGCSIQKGLLMSLIIRDFSLEKTVDLGVYRGRSLFPQAIAHKMYTSGIAYGVDPYSNMAAVQNDRPDLKNELETFVKETDFNQLYQEVNSLIKSENLQKNCQLIRETSAEASTFFKSNNYQLDLVHIDGNHDTKFVTEDATNYLPLLNPKGFIVLDDISWSSVEPAFEMLSNRMTFIDKIVDSQNDFALFAQGISDEDMKNLTSIFRIVKN